MGWKPRWAVEDALQETIDWYADWLSRRDGVRTLHQALDSR
jgi:dTDP-D-glucose 4,6-dehydratase